MKDKQIRRLAYGLVMTGLLVVSVPTFAQGRGGGGGDPQQRVERQLAMWTEELSLSDEQQAQLEPVLLDSAKQVRAAFDSNGGDRSAMRGAMQKIFQETHKKVEAILDEEQMARYREILAERRKSKSKGGGPPPPR